MSSGQLLELAVSKTSEEVEVANNGPWPGTRRQALTPMEDQHEVSDEEGHQNGDDGFGEGCGTGKSKQVVRQPQCFFDDDGPHVCRLQVLPVCEQASKQGTKSDRF